MYVKNNKTMQLLKEQQNFNIKMYKAEIDPIEPISTHHRLKVLILLFDHWWDDRASFENGWNRFPTSREWGATDA